MLIIHPAMNTMTFICGNECSKLPGYLLVYPKRSDVQLLGDSETKLKQYFFGQKRKPHLFCGECSSNVMIDFAASESEKQRPFLAMNVSSFLISLCEICKPFSWLMAPQRANGYDVLAIQ